MSRHPRRGVGDVCVACPFSYGVDHQSGPKKWTGTGLQIPYAGLLVVRSLSLPETGKGVAWLLEPDFSCIDIQVTLDALGHTFLPWASAFPPRSSSVAT